MYGGNRYIVPIADGSPLELIGSKGRNLHALVEKGYKVPLAFCLTTRAYELFVALNDLEKRIAMAINKSADTASQRSAEIMQLFGEADIPDQIMEEFRNNDAFRDERAAWAVRSSSDLEDQPSSSFAGLYDTYLSVRGLEQIIEAVQRCWASLWTERAIAYREENKIGHKLARMAVVLQLMVDAKVSGVLFTKDPTCPEQCEMMVEYCAGLADQLVSGRLRPCSCRVSLERGIVDHLAEGHCSVLGDHDILMLSSVGAQIERDFSLPQDVEWAFDGKDFYFLQTRPITGIGVPLYGLDQVWTRANIAEVLPNAVTPLTWSIFRVTLFSESILSTDPIEEDAAENVDVERDSESGIRRIQGRIYIRLRHFLDSFCYLPFVSPRVLEQVLGVDLPDEARSYIPPRNLAVRLAQGLFVLNALGIGDRLAKMAKAMPSLPASNDLDGLLSWNSRCFHLHLKCTAYSIGAFAFLAKSLRSWLSQSAEDLLPSLLIGRENLQTAAQGFSLMDMAERVRRYPALHDKLLRGVSLPGDSHDIGTLEGGLEFLELFDRFLESNGARAAEEFELATPRWSEDSGFLLEVLKKFLGPEDGIPDHVRRSLSMDRRAIVSQIKSELNPFQQWIFTRVLASYSEFCTLRENMKYRLMEGYGRLRQHFLECASQLVKRDVISAEEDVFFLTVAEVRSLMRSQERLREIRLLIEGRRQRHERWNSRKSLPLLVGVRHEPAGSAGDALSGIGCSGGVVEGRARVLMDASQAHLLNPGEILVTKYTDPGWTPLFLVANGLVAEIGGFLSHGATVAREYGLPAVVNVDEATSRIRTGDLIRLDGAKGRVVILASGSDRVITTEI